MKQYVLCTDSVLAFLEDRPGASTVEELLWKATQSQQSLQISVVSWGALLCTIWQTRSEQAAREQMKQLQQLPIDLVEVDAATADRAAAICATYDVPFVEAFAVALAQGHKATLVTTNKQLSKLGDNAKILVAA